MIFTVQHFIEDYFHNLNLSDSDQYSVRLANLYFQSRAGQKREDFLKKMHRLRTVFYKKNSNIDRSNFEANLLTLLDSKFKKKVFKPEVNFSGGLTKERIYLARVKRRTIKKILHEFKIAVESRAIDGFWLSRKKNKLRNKPEKIAQGLLAIFMKGTLGRRGLILRELFSGIGFVDVAIIIGRSLHLMEVKIINRSLTGIEQLGQYMQTESKREGWLIVFDARPENKKKINIQNEIILPIGTVRVLVININPLKPSAKDRS